MKKVALVIDNSGSITKEEMKILGASKLVPLSFIINGEEFFEEKNMTYEEFYQYLSQKNTNLSTSQPSRESVIDAWREVLTKYDEIVHLPLSSGLSETCNTAISASRDPEFNGKVFVVDNQRVSFMYKIAAYEASNMIAEGKSAKEIKDYLEEHKGDCALYIAVDSLKHLKKGGRVTPAAAAIGTLLKIKPILSVHGGKLDAYAKALAMRQARKKMISATRKEYEERFPEELKQGKIKLAIIHSNPNKNAKEITDFENDIRREFPDFEIFAIDPLPLFITCHTGPHCLGMGFVVDNMDSFKKVNNK